MENNIIKVATKAGRKSLTMVLPTEPFSVKDFQKLNQCSLPTAYNKCNEFILSNKILTVKKMYSGKGRKMSIFQAV